MFSKRVLINIVSAEGAVRLCPIKWIDNFAMRNFTNDAVFDDTLPIEDGLMELGARVPLHALRLRMEDWLTRKGWLKTGEKLQFDLIEKA